MRQESVHLSKEQMDTLYQELRRAHGPVTLYSGKFPGGYFQDEEDIREEIPPFHIVVKLSYADRPGWSAFEIAPNGLVFTRWSGGLD